MRFLTAVALALVMLWVPVDGVAQRDPLKGVISVDPQVIVTWSDIITLKSETQFTQEVETALELGLLRAGLKVAPDVLNFVNCEIILNTRDGVVLSYALIVSLREMVVPWLMDRGLRESPDYRQLASTWSYFWAGSVGVNKLDGAFLGEACAERFELEWRRANN